MLVINRPEINLLDGSRFMNGIGLVATGNGQGIEITAIYYIMAYVMVLRFNVPDVISSMVLGAIICLVCAIAINLRWKISIHMLGLGGVVGAIIGFSVAPDALTQPINKPLPVSV